MIERCTRGFLHRQAAREVMRQRDLERQRKVFSAIVTVVQKRYRGFYSRKYRHDYYARKAYLAAVMHKGEAVRKAVAEQQLQETEQRKAEADEKASLHPGTARLKPWWNLPKRALKDELRWEHRNGGTGRAECMCFRLPPKVLTNHVHLSSSHTVGT